MAVRPRKRTGGEGGASASPKSTVKRRRRRVANVSKEPTSLPGELGEVMRGIAKGKPGSRVARMAGDRRADYGRVKTGVLSLDLALGGGFKLSRGSMLYGEKSTGKSTLAAKVCANMQQMFPDQVAAWMDIEGTFDEPWAEKLGVDLDRLLIIEPETGEEAVDLADATFRSKEVSIVVTDSIAMLTPMKEIESSAEDSMVGVHARLVGNYIRRLNNAMLSERHRGHTPIVLHLNQFRMKIGVMFGDPRTLPGGKALEFATSQQVQTYNKEHQATFDGMSGIVDYNEHEFKVTKDKTGGRIKEGKFKLIRDAEITGLPEGFVAQAKLILKLGERAGVVSGKYTVEDCGKFRSADEFQRFLVENTVKEAVLCDKIIAYYRNRWGIS